MKRSGVSASLEESSALLKQVSPYPNQKQSDENERSANPILIAGFLATLKWLIKMSELTGVIELRMD